MKIAILGGTGQIARALTREILREGGHETVLFARRPELLADLPCRLEADFDALGREEFDLVVNGIGAGTPAVLRDHYENWFTVLEEFDDRALGYLRKHPGALYVMFSSGAVQRLRGLDPDRIEVADYYALAKLYAEAKHRAMRGMRIADIRIYSFFSRYSPLDAGYFITDLAAAVKHETELVTGPEDIVRDYIHPADLWRLIRRCAEQPKINFVCDAASAAPAAKSAILRRCQEEFGLRYRVAGPCGKSPNATAAQYVPDAETAAERLGFRAEMDSLTSLIEELKHV